MTLPVDLLDLMTVDLPDGSCDGLTVERFQVTAGDRANERSRAAGRGTAPGTYTRLRTPGLVWMSDVDCERADHLPAVERIADPATRRILINGLGIGMIVKAALAFSHVQQVDIVEIDSRVLTLVGPTYLRDPRVTLYQGDAYAAAGSWPPGTRWDLIWSDIWPDLITDNLPEMQRLQEAYAGRARWHGCWGQLALLTLRRWEQSGQLARPV